MEKAAYINSVSAYLPNSPIANEDMEDYIGKIGGNPSRVRSIVLRQNGINICLLYTSDAADDMQCVDLGGRRIIKKKKRK